MCVTRQTDLEERKKGRGLEVVPIVETDPRKRHDTEEGTRDEGIIGHVHL